MASRSYDITRDTLLDAIRTLVKDGVNAAFASVLDEPAVDSTYGFPFDLGLLSQTRTPAFFITRDKEQLLEHGLFRGPYADKRVDFKFVYVAPETPLGKLDVRWPLLKNVWASTVETVLCGDLENVIDWDSERMPDVSYTFATNGEFAFPIFTGFIRLFERPFDADTSGLPDANDLLVKQRLDGLPEEEQPFLISLHQHSKTIVVPPPPVMLSAFEADDVDPFERL